MQSEIVLHSVMKITPYLEVSPAKLHLLFRIELFTLIVLSIF